MKFLLSLITLLSLTHAFAQDKTDIHPGDLHVSKANAKIVSVKEICPHIPGQPSCAAYGSIVTLKVTLNGCVDRLGGYFTKFSEVDNKGILHFAGINIFNKGSIVTRCIQAPTVIVKAMVPYEGEIELVNLDYTGNN